MYLLLIKCIPEKERVNRWAKQVGRGAESLSSAPSLSKGSYLPFQEWNPWSVSVTHCCCLSLAGPVKSRLSSGYGDFHIISHPRTFCTGDARERVLDLLHAKTLNSHFFRKILDGAWNAWAIQMSRVFLRLFGSYHCIPVRAVQCHSFSYRNVGSSLMLPL